MNERPIPPAAERDPNAVELFRVWVAEHGLHCSIKVGMYQTGSVKEEKAWGIILADAAKHVANAMHDICAKSPVETMAAIRESFIAELDKPTSDAKGRIVD